MPILPTFSASRQETPVHGGRRAGAEDFYAGGIDGRALQAIGNDQYQRAEQDEARRALVESSQIRAKYARELDAAAQSGADLGPLKERMNAELSKIGENFQTKQGRDQLALYTANTELMYDEQANRINVQRASANAKLDAGKFLNSAGQIIQTNPEYLKTALQDADTFASTLKGVTPEARAQIASGLRNDLNMAAAVAAARLDPAGTAAKLDAGAWDLTPTQLETARRYAREQGDYQRRAQERDAELARAQAREASDRSESELASRIYRGDTSRELRNQVLDNPAFAADPGAKMRLMALMDAQVKRLRGEEREGSKGLASRMYLDIISGKQFGSGPIQEAVAEHNAGRVGLDTRQAEFLLGVLQRYKGGGSEAFGQKARSELQRTFKAIEGDVILRATPDGMRTIEAIKSTLATEFSKAEVDMREVYNENPQQLLDPESKYYFFKKDRLEAIKAQVVADERGNAVEAAISKGAPKVKGIGDPELLKVKDGDPFVDENNRLIKMTPVLRKRAEAAVKAAEKTKVKFPVVPSGETPDKIARREAEARGKKYHEWNSVDNMVDTARR